MSDRRDYPSHRRSTLERYKFMTWREAIIKAQRFARSNLSRGEIPNPRDPAHRTAAIEWARAHSHHYSNYIVLVERTRGTNGKSRRDFTLVARGGPVPSASQENIGRIYERWCRINRPSVATRRQIAKALDEEDTCRERAEAQRLYDASDLRHGAGKPHVDALYRDAEGRRDEVVARLDQMGTEWRRRPPKRKRRPTGTFAKGGVVYGKIPPPRTTKKPTDEVSEPPMSDEERRRYYRDKKRASRAKQRAEAALRAARAEEIKAAQSTAAELKDELARTKAALAIIAAGVMARQQEGS